MRLQLEVRSAEDEEVDARVLVLFGRLIVTTRPELELSKACAERSWL